jgi:molybdate/tungstate transport system substrate-binding protein
LERALGERGLLGAVLGDSRNSDQIVPSDQIIPMLRSGALDLAFLYRSHAVEEQLPFADLPETVNLGSAHLADEYAKAGYRSPMEPSTAGVR